MKRDLKELIQTKERHGWQIKRTNGGHFKWTAPNGKFFYSAQTPRDFRALRKIESDIKRIEENRI